MFKEFINKNVKVLYLDRDQKRIARGLLKEEDDMFIKVSGPLGTIIIKKNSVEKMGELK